MLLAAESVKQLIPKRQRAGSNTLQGSLSLSLPLSCLSLLSVWMSLCCDGSNLIFLIFSTFSFSISHCDEYSSSNLTVPLPFVSLCLSPSPSALVAMHTNYV